MGHGLKKYEDQQRIKMEYDVFYRLRAWFLKIYEVLDEKTGSYIVRS